MAGQIKEIPPVWTTGWTDILNTGTWRSAIPVHQRTFSPCQVNCPAGGEIPVWLEQVRKGEYRQAWLTLTANNPFPAVTGRVCHHPCESFCNRKEYDGAVTINALEQFIGDLALSEGWALPQPASGKDVRVAVIGGGPAGLSCAYQLRLSGYGVTVFEENPEPGGVLRYGIPGYRLPKEIVAGEINRLLKTGIEIRANTTIRADDIPQLEKEYAALCLAMGAPRAKTLHQFSAADPRVLNGLQFLAAVNRDDIPPLGRQVVVIGGGSVAMDVARAARRLNKQVAVLALEDRQSLPAQADEVLEALEEGVAIHDGVMVQTAAGHGEQLNLTCVKVVLDSTAPAGVLRPVPVPGTDFQLFADAVIVAVGQDPELTGYATILQVKNNIIEVDARRYTGRPGVFACGDAAGDDRFVSAAIGGGKRAAQSIKEFLAGPPALAGVGAPPPETVSFKEINTFYFPGMPRAEKETVAPRQRLQNFQEVKLNLSPAEAAVQAERCFSCGHCLKCDNCFYYCPDMAIVKDPALELGYWILDQYCKGCGLCVEECPRGAVLLKEVAR